MDERRNLGKVGQFFPAGLSRLLGFDLALKRVQLEFDYRFVVTLITELPDPTAITIDELAEVSGVRQPAAQDVEWKNIPEDIVGIVGMFEDGILFTWWQVVAFEGDTINLSLNRDQAFEYWEAKPHE